jgi:predicted kinase
LMMSKLAKKAHEYGSEFVAIAELDQACEAMEDTLSARIDANSDVLAEVTRRVLALENPKPAKRAKTKVADVKERTGVRKEQDG